VTGASYRTLPASAQNLGANRVGEAKCIEGSLIKSSLIQAMKIAHLNETSTFLDIGSGAGEPLVIAKVMFNCRLAVGLELMSARCAQTVRLALHNGCFVYPIHVEVESIANLSPATHVYCFMQGMNSSVENAIKEAIVRSPTVMYCILTKKILHDESERFEQIKSFLATMSRSDSGKTMVYVYRRIAPKPRPATRHFHPVFTIPIFALRLPHHWQQGLLRAYGERLECSNYKPKYFCAVAPDADQMV
jgi:hypothetical protein